MSYKRNIYKPRYRISFLAKSKIWIYKDSRLRRFFNIRGRKIVRRGLFKRTVLVFNNMKWTVARRFIRPFKAIRRGMKRKYRYNFYAKQQLRNFYGKSKEQYFCNFFKKYLSKMSIFNKYLVGNLERRLDVFLYRTRLLPTIYACHQLIHYHGVLVNGKLEKAPHAILRIGDVLYFEKEYYDSFFFYISRRMTMRLFGFVLFRRRKLKKHKKIYKYLRAKRRLHLRNFSFDFFKKFWTVPTILTKLSLIYKQKFYILKENGFLIKEQPAAVGLDKPFFLRFVRKYNFFYDNWCKFYYKTISNLGKTFFLSKAGSQKKKWNKNMNKKKIKIQKKNLGVPFFVGRLAFLKKYSNFIDFFSLNKKKSQFSKFSKKMSFLTLTDWQKREMNNTILKANLSKKKIVNKKTLYYYWKQQKNFKWRTKRIFFSFKHFKFFWRYLLLNQKFLALRQKLPLKLKSDFNLIYNPFLQNVMSLKELLFFLKNNVKKQLNHKKKTQKIKKVILNVNEVSSYFKILRFFFNKSKKNRKELFSVLNLQNNKLFFSRYHTVNSIKANFRLLTKYGIVNNVNTFYKKQILFLSYLKKKRFYLLHLFKRRQRFNKLARYRSNFQRRLKFYLLRKAPRFRKKKKKYIFKLIRHRKKFQYGLKKKLVRKIKVPFIWLKQIRRGIHKTYFNLKKPLLKKKPNLETKLLDIIKSKFRLKKNITAKRILSLYTQFFYLKENLSVNYLNKRKIAKKKAKLNTKINKKKELIAKEKFKFKMYLNKFFFSKNFINNKILHRFRFRKTSNFKFFLKKTLRIRKRNIEKAKKDKKKVISFSKSRFWNPRKSLVLKTKSKKDSWYRYYLYLQKKNKIKNNSVLKKKKKMSFAPLFFLYSNSSFSKDKKFQKKYYNRKKKIKISFLLKRQFFRRNKKLEKNKIIIENSIQKSKKIKQTKDNAKYIVKINELKKIINKNNKNNKKSNRFRKRLERIKKRKWVKPQLRKFNNKRYFRHYNLFKKRNMFYYKKINFNVKKIIFGKNLISSDIIKPLRNLNRRSISQYKLLKKNNNLIRLIIDTRRASGFKFKKRIPSLLILKKTWKKKRYFRKPKFKWKKKWKKKSRKIKAPKESRWKKKKKKRLVWLKKRVIHIAHKLKAEKLNLHKKTIPLKKKQSIFFFERNKNKLLTKNSLLLNEGKRNYKNTQKKKYHRSRVYSVFGARHKFFKKFNYVRKKYNWNSRNYQRWYFKMKFDIPDFRRYIPIKKFLVKKRYKLAHKEQITWKQKLLSKKVRAKMYKLILRHFRKKKEKVNFFLKKKKFFSFKITFLPRNIEKKNKFRLLEKKLWINFQKKLYGLINSKNKNKKKNFKNRVNLFRYSKKSKLKKINYKFLIKNRNFLKKKKLGSFFKYKWFFNYNLFLKRKNSLLTKKHLLKEKLYSRFLFLKKKRLKLKKNNYKKMLNSLKKAKDLSILLKSKKKSFLIIKKFKNLNRLKLLVNKTRNFSNYNYDNWTFYLKINKYKIFWRLFFFCKYKKYLQVLQMFKQKYQEKSLYLMNILRLRKKSTNDFLFNQIKQKNKLISFHKNKKKKNLFYKHFLRRHRLRRRISSKRWRYKKKNYFKKIYFKKKIKKHKSKKKISKNKKIKKIENNKNVQKLFLSRPIFVRKRYRKKFKKEYFKSMPMLFKSKKHFKKGKFNILRKNRLKQKFKVRKLFFSRKIFLKKNWKKKIYILSSNNTKKNYLSFLLNNKLKNLKQKKIFNFFLNYKNEKKIKYLQKQFNNKILFSLKNKNKNISQFPLLKNKEFYNQFKKMKKAKNLNIKAIDWFRSYWRNFRRLKKKFSFFWKKKLGLRKKIFRKKKEMSLNKIFKYLHTFSKKYNYNISNIKYNNSLLKKKQRFFFSPKLNILWKKRKTKQVNFFNKAIKQWLLKKYSNKIKKKNYFSYFTKKLRKIFLKKMNLKLKKNLILLSTVKQKKKLQIKMNRFINKKIKKIIKNLKKKKLKKASSLYRGYFGNTKRGFYFSKKMQIRLGRKRTLRRIKKKKARAFFRKFGYKKNKENKNYTRHKRNFIKNKNTIVLTLKKKVIQKKAKKKISIQQKQIIRKKIFNRQNFLKEKNFNKKLNKSKLKHKVKRKKKVLTKIKINFWKEKFASKFWKKKLFDKQWKQQNFTLRKKKSIFLNFADIKKNNMRKIPKNIFYTKFLHYVVLFFSIVKTLIFFNYFETYILQFFSLNIFQKFLIDFTKLYQSNILEYQQQFLLAKTIDDKEKIVKLLVANQYEYQKYCELYVLSADSLKDLEFRYILLSRKIELLFKQYLKRRLKKNSAQMPYYKKRFLKNFLKWHKRHARKRFKFPRFKRIHWYWPNYMFMHIHTLSATLVSSPLPKDIIFPFKVSLNKLYSFYKSRGFK